MCYDVAWSFLCEEKLSEIHSNGVSGIGKDFKPFWFRLKANAETQKKKVKTIEKILLTIQEDHKKY